MQGSLFFFFLVYPTITAKGEGFLFYFFVTYRCDTAFVACLVVYLLPFTRGCHMVLTGTI